jgi:hypothetical protein
MVFVMIASLISSTFAFNASGDRIANHGKQGATVS